MKKCVPPKNEQDPYMCMIIMRIEKYLNELKDIKTNHYINKWVYR